MQKGRGKRKIRRKQNEGVAITECLKQSKKLTAGHILQVGQLALEPVFSEPSIITSTSKGIKKKVEKKWEIRERNIYIKSLDALLDKVLTVLLRYKKRKTNPKLPIKKSEILSLYHKWYTPNLLTFQVSPPNSPALSDVDNKMNTINGKDDKEEMIVEL